MSAHDNIQDNGLLRFMTCGSVDDGKSTLIGRLLYDTKTILADMGYTEEQVKTMEEQFAIGFAGMPRMPPRPAAPAAGEAPKQGMAGMLAQESKK